MKKGTGKASRRKKVLTIVLVILLFAIVGAGTIVVFKMKDGGFQNSEEKKQDGFQEITNEQDLEDIEVKIEKSEDFVEPASGTFDIDKIEGFTAETFKNTSDVADENTSSESDEAEEQFVITLDDPNLVVEAVGSYSGNFLEDGSDEPTANVAAMLITNNSDQMLQIGEITFQVSDTETAEFKVTNLPSGTTTLVLESNKREFKTEDSYTHGETATGYMEQPTLEEDKFELITTEKGKITLKNKTDESYDKVYVYYKYVQLGGAYLGGITYRTPFENVPAGGEVEAVAGHFNPDSSQIMAVQIQE